MQCGTKAAWETAFGELATRGALQKTRHCQVPHLVEPPFITKSQEKAKQFNCATFPVHSSYLPPVALRFPVQVNKWGASVPEFFSGDHGECVVRDQNFLRFGGASNPSLWPAQKCFQSHTFCSMRICMQIFSSIAWNFFFLNFMWRTETFFQ